MDADGLYARGEAAYFAGLLSSAEPLLRQAAEAGHLDAITRLGRVYDASGDKDQAIRWYRTAAERGDTDAMTNLAILIEDDDRDAALDWTRRALALGAGLTTRYNLGIFCEEDGHLDEAEACYRRAAVGAIPRPGTVSPASSGRPDIRQRRRSGSAAPWTSETVCATSQAMTTTSRTRPSCTTSRHCWKRPAARTRRCPSTARPRGEETSKPPGRPSASRSRTRPAP